MFDPVKLFEDIATSNGLTFIYGARHFQNWEITQKDLTDGSLFLGMFPFEERGQVHNGSVSSWIVSTILCVGAKFDPAGTFSNLDETEMQKYDRRLKTFSAMVQTILDDLCASDVELIGEPRRFRELNKFDENTDYIGCELSFVYDIQESNSVPVIPVALPASDIGDMAFIATWEKIIASGYYLDVATDLLFTNKVVNNRDCGNVSFSYVSGLNSETTYYYRVRAYNTTGTSGNSNVITAVTLELGT